VTTYTEADLAQRAELVRALHGIAVLDQDVRVVGDGVDVISSGAGFHYHPPRPVADLVRGAIEAGYGQALCDPFRAEVPDLHLVRRQRLVSASVFHRR
jgi:hypothetical protein